MISNKNFSEWNEQKQSIHNCRVNKFYRAREIWWCSLGVNIGFEQDGTGNYNRRPVLILKGLSRNTCFAIPLTTSLKQHPMRICLGIIGNKKTTAIISQMRIIDTKRLVRKIGDANKEKFEEIEALRLILTSRLGNLKSFTPFRFLDCTRTTSLIRKAVKNLI